MDRVGVGVEVVNRPGAVVHNPAKQNPAPCQGGGHGDGLRVAAFLLKPDVYGLVPFELDLAGGYALLAEALLGSSNKEILEAARQT